VIAFRGGANTSRRERQTPPRDVPVTLSATPTEIKASFGPGLKDRAAAVLAVDAATGKPVPLGYALQSERVLRADGTLEAVRVPATALPREVRLHAVVDDAVVATETIEPR
jgi:hypothetical protein